MTPGHRILILGANGQVGRELRRSFAGAGQILTFDREECDLASPNQLRALIRNTAANLILNAAAYTAVDGAETEKDLATSINATAPRILAEEALRSAALLVHYSTDYVFDGSKSGPWVETDQPNPLNHYGASKLAGEQAVAEVGGRYLILRTSWVYGPHGNNFLNTMLRLGRKRNRIAVVDDQAGAPTTSMALADATRTILDNVLNGAYDGSGEWPGLYHMTCSGSTTWCGFAREILARAEQRLGQPAPEVIPISSDEWPAPAKRPRNSVLSNAKLLQQFGVQLPAWQTELDRTLMQVPLETP